MIVEGIAEVSHSKFGGPSFNVRCRFLKLQCFDLLLVCFLSRLFRIEAFLMLPQAALDSTAIFQLTLQSAQAKLICLELVSALSQLIAVQLTAILLNGLQLLSFGFKAGLQLGVVGEEFFKFFRGRCCCFLASIPFAAGEFLLSDGRVERLQVADAEACFAGEWAEVCQLLQLFLDVVPALR